MLAEDNSKKRTDCQYPSDFQPGEKFNIRVTIECIRKKITENEDLLSKPLSKFENIIQGTDSKCQNFFCVGIARYVGVRSQLNWFCSRASFEL